MSEYQLNEAQETWLKALESGEYEQGMRHLFVNGAYCCLGVACLVAGMTADEIEQFDLNESSSAPLWVANSLRLKNRSGGFENGEVGLKGQCALTSANDSGATFSEIAAFIRSNPTAVFKE